MRPSAANSEMAVIIILIIVLSFILGVCPGGCHALMLLCQFLKINIIEVAVQEDNWINNLFKNGSPTQTQTAPLAFKAPYAINYIMGQHYLLFKYFIYLKYNFLYSFASFLVLNGPYSMDVFTFENQCSLFLL